MVLGSSDCSGRAFSSPGPADWGAASLLYLAAAGVGRITVVDDDSVDLSNLQRQVVHDTGAVGEPKVQSAARRLAAINPDVRVDPVQGRITAATAAALIADHDVVLDGTDNFATRYLLADACHLARIPLVTAAMLRFDGQATVSMGYAGPETPCYRCLFPEPPPAGTVPSCAEAGVLGALAGLMGSLQALEAVKLLVGLGEPLVGRLLLVDSLSMQFDTMTVAADPSCPLCGTAPTITDLSAHA